MAAPSMNFASLFEASMAKTEQLREGDIVSGRVVKVTKEVVVVDIGFKSEGVIAINEFVGASGVAEVKAGDIVEVLVESKEDDDGIVTLSKEKADKLKVWDEISLACEREELITGTITSRVKGGLAVTIRGGVKAFLPGSQVDLRPVRNLDRLLGQSHEFKVIKFNKKRGNIVLSRRALLEQQRDELKQATLETLEEGQIVTGKVKNLTEYGAFVDLGGIDGLLHITDMSWGRVNHPSEVFNVGDEVTVKVLKYNSDTERVSLGIKQTQEDPWNIAERTYKPEMRVRGKVVSLTDYGAFVELEQGVEGLIHVSEMSWRKPKHPSKMLEIGQEVECAVIEVDAQNKRISLGMKQLEPDPWTAFIQKYNPGDIIRGKIRSITEYGLFVGIEDGVDGMVHKSDISWSTRFENPLELYQKGDEVEAIILSINEDDQRVSLGIRQLYEDPWTFASERYPLGTVIEVRVAAVGDYGAYAEIERGIEGLISSQHLDVTPQEGQMLKAEVIHIDGEARSINLSIKGLENKEINVDPAKFAQARAAQANQDAQQRRIGPSGSGSVTLGDLLKDKLIGLSGDKSESSDE